MDEVQEIKSRLPIEQLVGSYVPLKKAGRIYKGLCPFHHEKTPSFTVSPERGIFKCFGCGEGGDIFDFIMKIEGVSFPEALELLAQKAGVTLPQKRIGRANQEKTTGKERLFRLNGYLAKVWHTLLLEHPKAVAARSYLAGRGLEEATIKDFQIGYAPLGSGSAVALEKTGFTRQEISAAGNPTKFQDRVIFPICDITGKVVGFTGRLLEHPDDPPSHKERDPKYWNSPETPVFSKSHTVFALHLAKHAIQEADLAILAEGQMDVAMLHQGGYHNSVATSGTALTTPQLRLIARFSTNIAFAYDGDKAGREATKRGLELALQEELDPFVIQIPSGKDPADCIKDSPDLWQKAYEKRLPFMHWLIEEVSHGFSQPLSPNDKKTIVRELHPWFGRIQDPVENQEWRVFLAAKLQINLASLQEAFGRFDQKGSITKKSPASEEPKPIKKSDIENKIEIALALLVSFPEALIAVQPQLQQLQPPTATPFITRLLPLFQKAPVEKPADWLAKQWTEDEEKTLSIQIEELLKTYQEQTDFGAPQGLEVISSILAGIRQEQKKDIITRAAAAIAEAQTLGDQDKVKALFSELKNLL